MDKKTNNFVIKTYMSVHSCQKATRNYLCNSRFIATVFKKKVIEQPNIRVFKLQELIRKKCNVHVGKTTTRKARAKILNELMGDHVKEFGRILDYKDVLLRTNPGSTCVVKLMNLVGQYLRHFTFVLLHPRWHLCQLENALVWMVVS